MKSKKIASIVDNLQIIFTSLLANKAKLLLTLIIFI